MSCKNVSECIYRLIWLNPNSTTRIQEPTECNSDSHYFSIFHIMSFSHMRKEDLKHT